MKLRTAVSLTIPCLLALCSRASASGPFIYGYVSSFGQQSAATSQADMDWLASYHVNDVQFYDWQWKQHVPLAGTVQAPAASWNDIAARTNYRQTVQDLIAACHIDGMKAMNYNLIYGAWAGYGQDGSGVSYTWGLWYGSNGTQQWSDSLPGGWSTPTLYMFNPADPNWQSYIFSREADAINAYGFDGWQADQLGAPGQVYTFSGTPVNVANTFAGFLNNAKTALNTSIVFNNVGGYGLQSVASQTNDDAVYVECWPQNGQATYNDLKTVIDEGLNWGNGKPVVLAAYMDSNLSSGTFGTAGVLLTDATIFANGATHLELGDDGNMLSQPYFPNHNVKLSASLANTLHSYYNFIVDNQSWLYAGMANSANSTVLTGVPSAAVATAGDVWTLTKTSATNHRQMINLINLVGESTINWTDANGAEPAPTTQNNLPVKYYYGSGTISSVNFASPDINSPAVQSLAFQTGSDSGGNYVSFTVPALYYWDTIMLNTAAVSSGWASSAGGSWTRAAGNWTNGTPGLAGDTATFGSGPGLTSAGTITLDGNVYVGHLVFNNANSYTIAQGSAGTLTIDNTDGSGNPDITVASGNHTILAPVALANGVTVNTAAGASLNISGALAGTGGLTKAGGGLLELSGNGSFTGTTNITGGTLVGDTASLPTAISLANNANVTFNQVSNGMFGNAISGSGSVVKTGAGVLTLSASSNYCGRTIINGGTLKLQGSTTGSTTYNFDNGSLQGWSAAMSGAYSFAPMNSANGNGGVGGAQSGIYWVSDSNGTFGARGNEGNTQFIRSPQFTLGSGSLSFYLAGGSHNALPANASSVLSSPHATGGYQGVALESVSTGQFVLTQPGAGNTSNWTQFSFSPSQLAPYVGGTYTLDLINDYNGSWGWIALDTVSIPRVIAAVANLLPIATPVSIAANSALDLCGGHQQIASLSDYATGNYGSVINSNSASASVLTISSSDGSTTFSGMIGGGTLGAISLAMSGGGTQVLAGSLIGPGSVIVNAGELILSGSNGYTGGTDVEGGTLIAASSTALPDGSSLTVGTGVGATFIFDPSLAGLAVTNSAAAVPEPSTLIMLGVGAVGLLASAWRGRLSTRLNHDFSKTTRRCQGP